MTEQIRRLHGPYKQGNFTLGNNSYLQRDTLIVCGSEHHITIGDNCGFYIKD